MNTIKLLNGNYTIYRDSLTHKGVTKLIERALKEKKRTEELIELMREQNFESEKFNTLLKNLDADIKTLKKELNKINCYRAIKIENHGDYETDTTIIKFTKDFKNIDIKNWLYNNDYPTKTERYNINSMYDCTNQVYLIDVVIKNQIATITRYRDL